MELSTRLMCLTRRSNLIPPTAAFLADQMEFLRQHVASHSRLVLAPADFWRNSAFSPSK